MLDQHPRIEIRLYNPTGVVGRKFLPKAFAVLADFHRLNRRMHNKALVVDGAAAIIGGRNVADEYYDMHREFNFRDRDVLDRGTDRAQIAEGFDRYWNSVWSVPVEAFVRGGLHRGRARRVLRGSAGPMRRIRSTSRSGSRPRWRRRRHGSPISRSRLVWGEARLIYDIPGKNDDIRRLDAFGETGRRLTDAAAQAKQRDPRRDARISR